MKSFYSPNHETSSFQILLLQQKVDEVCVLLGCILKNRQQLNVQLSDN